MFRTYYQHMTFMLILLQICYTLRTVSFAARELSDVVSDTMVAKASRDSSPTKVKLLVISIENLQIASFVITN